MYSSPALRGIPEHAVRVGNIPNVRGLSQLDAALAYAAIGFHLLPTDPSNIKNPGSVVGGSWQKQSTRDPEQIRKWWNANPACGIALHCGPSRVLAFDFDRDDLGDIERDGRPDIAAALRECPTVHLTRATGDRGHYLYALRAGEDYGNSAGGFAPWGEVRGRNGVIILAPTPHPDADTKGGLYHWKASA